jgi:coiled-coil domain-containing protein 130
MRLQPPCRDDYASNKQLRRQMRVARKEEKARDDRRKALNLPEHIKLLPESKGDALIAAATSFGGDFQGAWRHKRREIGKQSIFSAAAVAAAAPNKGAPGKRPAPAPATAAKQRRLAANVKLRLSEPGSGKQA